ncbi:hypothetical protein PC110_g19141 [Phytophthora cactorum]|uniref:Uncharacterized protein n=1 Tax=Phytophthora cactorum TaxID=29920 RepID=A0A329RJC4_9STRA|nr:hypothetical protein PC110_g19141 [Phytophthora cactorum]
MKSAQAKKTRKPSAAQVAKEKGERRAAAELLCGASADAEERDAVALEETRKKLEAISATKARKRQKTTVAMPTQVSPTRYNIYSRIDAVCYAGTYTILQHRSILFYTA